MFKNMKTSHACDNILSSLFSAKVVIKTETPNLEGTEKVPSIETPLYRN
jgi:hypothetical protein